ncbi:MAG: DNA-binding protein [Marinilabiliales bacterium]|nr:MAG: DNA-binding protein [Marinilabiliales bacterium]
MPRPESDRIIHEPPLFTEFKPMGIPGRNLEQIKLSLDECEALRLADHEGLSHEEAADQLEISRSTFTRLIRKARKKVADFMFLGKILTISGGNVHFKNNIIRCLDCGHIFRVEIDTRVSKCPECHSNNLLNAAGGFGHGNCCWEKTEDK